VVEETTDSAVTAPEEEERETEESFTELLEQLGRELAVLVFYESRLAAARHKPELRRAGRDAITALAALAAFLTAFVLATTAALLALSNVMAGWLAALVLAAAWSAVGVLLALVLWARAKRAGRREGETVEEASERAEQAVRAILERLGPAITTEIALAAVPSADGVVELGEDLIEGADDIVDAVTEELPGGGVVNQAWDVFLAPGRFGIRVATTVLKRGEPGE
jgi:Putative Actinobacterial Holin-X, holin superfamily III